MSTASGQSVGMLMQRLRLIYKVDTLHLKKHLRFTQSAFEAFEKCERLNLTKNQQSALSELLGVPKNTMMLLNYRSEVPQIDMLVVKWQSHVVKRMFKIIEGLEKGLPKVKRKLARGFGADLILTDKFSGLNDIDRNIRMTTYLNEVNVKVSES